MQYQHITEIQWASSNALPVRLQSMEKLDEISNVQIFPCEMFGKKGKKFRFHLPSARDRFVTKYMSKNCAKDLPPFGYQYKLAKLDCRVWWIPLKGSNQWQLLFNGHIFQFPFHIFFQKSIY